MQEFYLNSAKGWLRKKEEKDKETESSGKIRLMGLSEFKELEGAYPHKRNLYRSMNPVQYCKAESYGDCLFGTMKIPRVLKGKVTYIVFGFYLRGDELLLIDDGSFLKTCLGKLEKMIPAECSTEIEVSMHQLLVMIFEMLIEDDVIYLQQQEEKLASIEEELLKKIPEHFYEIILQYRKRFSAYHAYYEQLVNLADSMQSDFGQILTDKERSLWQLYANRVERLHDHVELLREYLVQIRELYQSLIDVQQNKVMSILTVVTTIFLPLTLIAGWYGMNFPNMPEFGWKYAYPAVIIISICIIAGEIIYFKKKKML